MPVVGETKRAREIGRTDNRGSQLFIWHACVDCGKERWVSTRSLSQRCNHCNGEFWGKMAYRGGRTRTSEGYVLLKLYPDDFFYPMVDCHGYVLEHRLVMAKSMGRNLHRWEIVHHRNHIRDDNRIENLQLFNDNGHSSIPQVCNLRRRIAYLEKLLDENGVEYKPLHWANRS